MTPVATIHTAAVMKVALGFVITSQPKARPVMIGAARRAAVPSARSDSCEVMGSPQTMPAMITTMAAIAVPVT